MAKIKKKQTADTVIDRLSAAMGEEPEEHTDDDRETDTETDTENAEVSAPEEISGGEVSGEDTSNEEMSAEETTTEPTTAEPAGADPTPADTVTEEDAAAKRLDNAEFTFLDENKDNPFRNVFVDSLEGVTADDLGKPPKKKKKDPVDIVIGAFRQLIFWVAVVVFFGYGYQVVYKLYSYRQSEDIYDFDNMFAVEDRREDLVATATRDTRLAALTPVNGTREESAELSDAADSVEYNETFEMMKGQLLILRNKNPEVIGWIRMEGDTEINYPVVQHEDNEYYLHYAYDGTYNPAGSIYLDYKNNVALSSNRHSIIYGHNMESGSPMFSNLLHYREDGFWDDNRYIDIYTDDALYTYEVFAAYETNPSQTVTENHSWRMNFKKDDATFLAWIDSIRARSDISPDVEIDADSRILTLSTCMNVNENRYVVHAVLVEVVK